MKSHLALIVLLLALPGSFTAAADCVPEELPATDPSPGTAESQVRLHLVDPANGAAVDADSTVVIEVDYRVAGFQPGEFGLMTYFTSLVASISPFGPEGRYLLPKAYGRVRLCVPLREVYATPQLRWPLSMHVSLNKRMDNLSPRFSASFEPVVASAAVSLNSVRPAEASQRAQVNAVQPAYREAVTRLMGFVVGTEALAMACADVPEVTVEFTAAHRGWLSRNGSLVDRIRVLQRDLYSRDLPSSDLIEEVMNLQMTHALNRLEGMSPDQLQGYCRRLVLALSDPRSDLETAVAADLAVVRTQAPAGVPAPR